MPYYVMLDAGHGGRDPGSVYNGRQEKDDNLRLTLAVGEQLQNSGIDVEYTRTTDIYESPYQKALEANEAGVDFFISFHRNSSETPEKYSGVECLLYDLSGEKYRMAENINAQLETVGFVDLGIEARPNLVVLRKTRMPAILVEMGFINSTTDNRLFDRNFDDIVSAIASAVIETLHATKQIYTVQTGAFSNALYAKKLCRELTEQDFPAYIDESGRYDRVLVGRYSELDEAVAMEKQLKKNGYSTLIRTLPVK